MRLLGAFVVMLGSAVSPSPDPAGSGGANPGNYRGAWWIVVAMVVVVVIIGAGTFYLRRTRRIDLNPLSDEDEQRRDEAWLESLRHDEHRSPTDKGN